ncbi:hypothetical protein ACQY0O_006385 [Thecaphora frezii]
MSLARLTTKPALLPVSAAVSVAARSAQCHLTGARTLHRSMSAPMPSPSLKLQAIRTFASTYKRNAAYNKPNMTSTVINEIKVSGSSFFIIHKPGPWSVAWDAQTGFCGARMRRRSVSVQVDHDNVRDLLQRFGEAHKQKDAKLMVMIANTLVREASIHSDAEEMSTYRAMDKHDMHDVAEHDRIEHNEVKKLMSKVDGEDPDRLGLDEYAALVVQATTLFLKHAEDEENDHLLRLVAKMSAEDQLSVTNAFLEARKTATTRPHPMAPQSGGMAQKAAEAMSKPMDEAAHKMREHVELKFKHAEVGQH